MGSSRGFVSPSHLRCVTGPIGSSAFCTSDRHIVGRVSPLRYPALTQPGSGEDHIGYPALVEPGSGGEIQPGSNGDLQPGSGGGPLGQSSTAG